MHMLFSFKHNTWQQQALNALAAAYTSSQCSSSENHSSCDQRKAVFAAVQRAAWQISSDKHTHGK